MLVALLELPYIGCRIMSDAPAKGENAAKKQFLGNNFLGSIAAGSKLVAIVIFHRNTHFDTTFVEIGAREHIKLARSHRAYVSFLVVFAA